jgi:hypothetical protein
MKTKGEDKKQDIVQMEVKGGEVKVTKNGVDYCRDIHMKILQRFTKERHDHEELILKTKDKTSSYSQEKLLCEFVKGIYLKIGVAQKFNFYRYKSKKYNLDYDRYSYFNDDIYHIKSIISNELYKYTKAGCRPTHEEIIEAFNERYPGIDFYKNKDDKEI